MESYSIRIELSEPTENSQRALLYSMLENGFSRSVVCEKGRTFALPANEFVYYGPDGIRTLTDRVTTLVGEFSHDPLVLVTRSAERCWSSSSLQMITLNWNY